jgi:hypothetical protein
MAGLETTTSAAVSGLNTRWSAPADLKDTSINTIKVIVKEYNVFFLIFYPPLSQIIYPQKNSGTLCIIGTFKQKH